MRSDFDWRLHGVEEIEVISHSTVQIRAGGSSTLEMVDPVPLADGRILALPLPNATAMFLHASRRAYDNAQQLLGGDLHKINPRDTVRMRSSSEAVGVTENWGPCGVCCLHFTGMLRERKDSTLDHLP